MVIHISNRVQRIKPSPTLAVAAKAAQLKAEGKDIISLGTGEPDFDTPEAIKNAAIEALNKGFTKYTAVDGTPGLKTAIINKLKRDNQLTYTAKQICVSVGAKQAIYNLCQAILNDGDEVIVPAPYWVSYPDMALLAGGVPVYIEAGVDNDFKITPVQLEQAITPKTKLVFLNSPSNPTGKVYTKAELLGLAEVLRKHPHVVIATDDIYEFIIWHPEGFNNILNVAPDLQSRTVLFNGVSKAYAMTGWRIGYAAGPDNVIDAMKNVQSQCTSNPTSIAQVAAEFALNGEHDTVKQMCAEFKKRHDFVYSVLREIPGVKVTPADGTFYIFPDVSEIIKSKGMKNDLEFSEKLLNEVGLALVPGSAFGSEGCIRLSFATSMTVLKDALDRLQRFINS